MDKSLFLFNAFNPPSVKATIHEVDSRCALTGRLITRGCRVSDLVTDATSQPHEIFKFPSEYCSVETACLFKSMRGEVSMLGNLFADDSGGSKPMVSRDSAEKQARPCWHDLIMALEPGVWTVAVFTEESKRRFWLDAPLSQTGNAWRPYLHWQNTSRVLTINLSHLQTVLTLCEQVYSYGFSKDSMLTGLFDNFQQVQKYGFSRTLQLENQLSAHRDTDELLLACYVVQKNTSIIAEQPQEENTECQPTFLETPSPEPTTGQLALL